MKTELQRFDDPTTPEATAVSDHKDVHRLEIPRNVTTSFRGKLTT